MTHFPMFLAEISAIEGLALLCAWLFQIAIQLGSLMIEDKGLENLPFRINDESPSEVWLNPAISQILDMCKSGNGLSMHV